MHAALIASLAALAVAAPAKRQAATPPAGVTDATILQYALTLEHLENAFYREAISKFTLADFEAAGLKASFLDNLKQIKFDEQTHVDYLTAGLTAAGATPVAECTYNFGLADVPTFLAIANVLEGVGVSAYLGAAKFVKSPDYLTAAGSILTVESRHSAYLRENQTPALSPFPSPFDVALDFNQVFSLAAPFITGCPAGPSSSLEVLKGFKAFPAITVSPAGTKTAGEVLTLKVATSVDAKAAYFVTSGGYTKAEFSVSGDSYSVTVPAIGVPNLQPGTVAPGQAYLILTKDDQLPTDDNTVAGPAAFEIADNAYGRPADEKDCTTIVAYPSQPASAYPSKPAAPTYSKPAEAMPTKSAPAAPYPYPHPYPHPSSAQPTAPVYKPASTYEAAPKPTHPAPKPVAPKPYAPVYESTSCTEESPEPTPTGYGY